MLGGAFSSFHINLWQTKTLTHRVCKLAFYTWYCIGRIVTKNANNTANESKIQTNQMKMIHCPRYKAAEFLRVGKKPLNQWLGEWAWTSWSEALPAPTSLSRQILATVHTHSRSMKAFCLRNETTCVTKFFSWSTMKKWHFYPFLTWCWIFWYSSAGWNRLNFIERVQQVAVHFHCHGFAGKKRVCHDWPAGAILSTI